MPMAASSLRQSAEVSTRQRNKAYMMLGIIKRNFVYISRNCFVTLYKSLVRSHLEYANSVWYPKRKTVVDKLEVGTSSKEGYSLL